MNDSRPERPRLLVIDDFGAGQSAEAKVEGRLLYFAMESRQNNLKSTIITSNLNAKDVASELGKRVVDRLEPYTLMAFTHGTNFRRKSGGTTTWEAH